MYVDPRGRDEAEAPQTPMHTDEYARLYDLEERFWWFAGMRAITAALLDPICRPGTDRRVLDAGCGTGGMLPWLARYGGRHAVVGLELAAEPLGYCRVRGQTDLAQASVTDLPFADASFDLVTSFDILGHVRGEGADALAIAEMSRVLRPGGIAFVRVAAYQWMRSGHDEAWGTQRRYRLDQLRGLMTSAGFRVRRATYANSLLLPVAMLHRLVLKRLGLARQGSDVAPLSPMFGWLNHVLLRALRCEARWLSGPRSTLPAGLSAICVAERPHP